MKNFEISENEKEILSLNNEYAELINTLKNDKNKIKEYLNISFLPEQYEEAVVRLYLHFANFKIETLINKFEQQEKKDFSLLQQVEDLKKKKEIYQNTI
jgi:GTP-sensing pleiotropic transcriptional regulator CodY